MSAYGDESRVFVIVEAGVTAFGDEELAHRQVDAAVAAQADAVKFQAWKTENLVSRKVAVREREALGTDWFERLQARELSFAALRDLAEYARTREIAFFATPHDVTSLHFLDELGVPYIKVGSGESANFAFLREVGAVGRPTMISFGLQSEDDARRAVATLQDAGAPEVLAFHCMSIYPTPAALADLGRIARLRDALGVRVGISDHSVGTHVPIAAVALGATAIEKHLTFDKADPRSLDNPGALEPDEWVDFVREVREVEAALRPIADAERAELVSDAADWAGQAVVAARDLGAGATLTAGDLEAKRPARGGIPASELDTLVGRVLARAVEADEQIRRDDLA